MDWQIPLLASTAVFGGSMLWRMRPSLGRRGGTLRAILREAHVRLEGAADDPAKALALVDAADACARAIGRSASAVSYYLRAMRLDPASHDLVIRAVQGLARRPRALETLLWRRLGEPGTPASAEGTRVALASLVALYDRKQKTKPRARALEQLLAGITGPTSERAPPASRSGD